MAKIAFGFGKEMHFWKWKCLYIERDVTLNDILLYILYIIFYLFWLYEMYALYIIIINHI